MRSILVTVVLTLVFGACGPRDPADYAVLSEDENTALKKSNIEVRLVGKVDEARLKQIANELREDRSQIDNLWIFYYLSGMEVGKGAWATSHFTPDLVVEIVGNTKAEEETAKASPVAANETVLGKWYEEQVTRMGFTLLSREAKLYLRISFPGGGSMDREVRETAVQGTRRIDSVEPDSNGEYHVVEADGTLGLYGSDGRFAVAKPIE